MNRLIEKVLELIAPDDCLVCGAEGSLICSWCRPGVCLKVPSQCYKCQKQTGDFAVCEACRRKTVLKHVWMTTEYDKVASSIIKEVKFGYKRAGTYVIASYMDETLPFVTDQTIIVPVPTAPHRVRERGFDQALLIADHLAKMRNASQKRVLHRSGKTRQVGAHRRQRLEQLRNAFWVSGSVRGKHVVLVDDVVTTGATIESAALTLKKAGATRVDAIVFAQAK